MCVFSPPYISAGSLRSSNPTRFFLPLYLAAMTSMDCRVRAMFDGSSLHTGEEMWCEVM